MAKSSTPTEHPILEVYNQCRKLTVDALAKEPGDPALNTWLVLIDQRIAGAQPLPPHPKK